MDDSLRQFDRRALEMIVRKYIWEADLAWEEKKRAEEAYWKQRLAPKKAEGIEESDVRASSTEVRSAGDKEG